ncbi:MAG: hypothetical protein IJT79_09780 [Ruminococcus sp.]|nr:hypothetical protein [Ruminococcus sp.]
MKRIFALSVAVLILVFASVPAFAAKDNPSPTKPTDYNVIIHNPNGGTGTYTIEVDEDGQHATLVAHPKNGYEFVGWKINGKYVLESGSLTDEEITILLKSDVHAYPMFRKIGTSSVTSGSISINSGTTSPQTSDNSAMYFIIASIVLFVVAAGAVGIKVAVSKKK